LWTEVLASEERCVDTTVLFRRSTFLGYIRDDFVNSTFRGVGLKHCFTRFHNFEGFASQRGEVRVIGDYTRPEADIRNDGK
jgi:hypothetical protein